MLYILQVKLLYVAPAHASLNKFVFVRIEGEGFGKVSTQLCIKKYGKYHSVD